MAAPADVNELRRSHGRRRATPAPRSSSTHASNNPHFSYKDDDGEHDVWFLDAVTAFNQIHVADPTSRPAMRCGDWVLRIRPSAVLGRRYDLPAPQNLQHIAAPTK